MADVFKSNLRMASLSLRRKRDEADMTFEKINSAREGPRRLAAAA